MKLFSSKGSRAAGNNRATRKVSTLAIALILILAIGIGGTVAFLVANTNPITNSFTPADVTCEVNEEFSDNNTVKTSATVKNTGNIPAYIRVAVVANTIDKDGNVTGAANVSDKLASDKWTKLGDYYYYNEVVEPDASTDNLLKSGIELDGIQVTILASAIQSEPAGAVAQAWGVQFNNGTWSTVSGT